MERIRVSASKEYYIIIGENLYDTVGTRLCELVKGKNAAIFADETTYSLFGEKVKASLEKSGFKTFEFVVKPGEESKSAETYIEALNFLADRKLTRADCIVALGGGVVGDLTGFVAASYLRGIAFVQLPTTLLAAVDSSVGGKTAINLSAGKNLAGAFYQPSLVLCDVGVIKELPENVFSDGMAEVIKYGAIKSERLLELSAGDAREALGEIISECVKIKRDIVSVDEYDTGIRQLLNFGHTPAHAIEKLSDFGISHGSAVAAGMCIMARGAEKLGICDSGISEEIKALCEKYKLPTSCEFSPEMLYEVAMSDKKRSADYITLVVPKKRGESVLRKTSKDEVIGFFKLGTEGKE